MIVIVVVAVLLYHLLLLALAVMRLPNAIRQPILDRLDELDARYDELLQRLETLDRRQTDVVVRVALLERDVGEIRTSYRRALPPPQDGG